METTIEIVQRLETAATLLERTLLWLEERQSALTGQVDRISATVEQSHREEELSARLADAEQQIAELKAAAAQQQPAVSLTQTAMLTQSLRRTMPASTTEMLAKHGIGEGPVEIRALDAALSGLSLEQRIAVKSQLMRAGSLA